MTSEQRPPGIALSLFDGLRTFAEQLRTAEIDPTDPGDRDSPAISFCENFFAQFFWSGWKLRIESLNTDTKTRAAALRLRLAGAADAPVRRLIAQFEELCDRWAELHGFYGGSAQDYVEFHRDYVPVLLACIQEWARSTHQDALAAAAAEAADVYDPAVASLSVG